MYSFNAAETKAFSFEGSVLEVDFGANSEFEPIANDDEVILIESYSQPFPLRERDKSVMDRERDSYG